MVCVVWALWWLRGITLLAHRPCWPTDPRARGGHNPQANQPSENSLNRLSDWLSLKSGTKWIWRISEKPSESSGATWCFLLSRSEERVKIVTWCRPNIKIIISTLRPNININPIDYWPWLTKGGGDRGRRRGGGGGDFPARKRLTCSHGRSCRWPWHAWHPTGPSHETAKRQVTEKNAVKKSGPKAQVEEGKPTQGRPYAEQRRWGACTRLLCLACSSDAVKWKQRHGTLAALATSMYLETKEKKQHESRHKWCDSYARTRTHTRLVDYLLRASGSGLVLSTATLRPSLRARSHAVTQLCHEPRVSWHREPNSESSVSVYYHRPSCDVTDLEKVKRDIRIDFGRRHCRRHVADGLHLAPAWQWLWSQAAWVLCRATANLA